MDRDNEIGATARMLGYAGLLPQLLALLLIATGIDPALGALAAFAYAAMILSFLGGTWWGFAMRHAQGQSWTALAAVVPMLVAFFAVLARVLGLPLGWGLVGIGSALILTLLGDRHVERLAPPGWIALRIPLSIALGALTILAGVLAPPAISIVYSAQAVRVMPPS